MSNQRQIAVAIQMATQDNGEILPPPGTVWGDLQVAPGLFICPTRGRVQANGYVYNSFVSGKAIGEISEPDNTMLTADGIAVSGVAIDYSAPYSANALMERPDGNTYFMATDVDFRHNYRFIASYLDGHVEMTTVTPPVDIEWVTNPVYAVAGYNGYQADDHHSGSALTSTNDSAIPDWARLANSGTSVKEGRVSFRLASTADVMVGMAQAMPTGYSALNFAIFGQRGKLTVVEDGLE